MFIEDVSGALSGVEGPFDIFGTFHVIIYFRGEQAFLIKEGTVFVQNIMKLRRKTHCFPLINLEIFG
ncbi:MAG: hypothetical protein EZS28_044558 [Streblomastix strix]|uniref:Uncharacterized protein n=1 Tax=Streblomastix strix TaxID=222440 RepID=A0A5J4TN12_9EUKA|nr:MAG: hypothetical protein EZS28_044558 [Streblomastix strix]